MLFLSTFSAQGMEYGKKNQSEFKRAPPNRKRYLRGLSLSRLLYKAPVPSLSRLSGLGESQEMRGKSKIKYWRLSVVNSSYIYLFNFSVGHFSLTSPYAATLGGPYSSRILPNFKPWKRTPAELAMRIFEQRTPDAQFPLYQGRGPNGDTGEIFHLYPRFQLRIPPHGRILHDSGVSLRLETGKDEAFLSDIDSVSAMTNGDGSGQRLFYVHERQYWYGVYAIILDISNAGGGEIIIPVHQPVAKIHYYPHFDDETDEEEEEDDVDDDDEHDRGEEGARAEDAEDGERRGEREREGGEGERMEEE